MTNPDNDRTHTALREAMRQADAIQNIVELIVDHDSLLRAQTAVTHLAKELQRIEPSHLCPATEMRFTYASLEQFGIYDGSRKNKRSQTALSAHHSSDASDRAVRKPGSQDC